MFVNVPYMYKISLNQLIVNDFCVFLFVYFKVLFSLYFSLNVPHLLYIQGFLLKLTVPIYQQLHLKLLLNKHLRSFYRKLVNKKDTTNDQ